MLTNLLPTITFVLIATFSPGPSNIASAAMGVLYGYRKTLPFLLGMVVGFFPLMSVCAWASTTVLQIFPTLQPILRYVGAAYILYLAYGMLQATYTFATDAMADITADTTADGKTATTAPMGFWKGFTLQALNPKLVVYGLTLFSTFLAPFADQPLYVALAVPLLACTAFCATSTWALFGTMIRSRLRYPKVQLAVNGLLALLLVYTALKLAELV